MREVELVPNSSVDIFDNERDPHPMLHGMSTNEASRRSAPVIEKEKSGMVPAFTLYESAIQYLQIAGFIPEQKVELKLFEMPGKDQ